MFDNKIIEEMAANLFQALPQNVSAIENDIEQKFKAILQSTFDKFELVTREEFDVQTKVLMRTREKVEALEKIVARLESDKGISQ